MKKIPFYCLCGLFLIFTSCQKNASTASQEKTTQKEPVQHKFAIAIHGGAGYIKPENFSDSLKQAYHDKLKEAITTGYTILKKGGNATDAVRATINVMENSPLFNAGKGAVLAHDEKPYLDASIMNGKTLEAGAVAGVSHIKNPINLALAVLEHSRHVMLYGKGAEAFAREQGFEMIPESYFITPRRLKQVQAVKREEANKTTYYDPYVKDKKFGTVGCVALDKNGNLAAGTSTGGLTNKRYGRIGDSPIIGAGTYANNKTCAVSCTGVGEYYIRGVVAYDVSALMQYAGLSLAEATHKIIHEKQPAIGGSGGIIAVDHYGNISLDFNTPGMFRAQMDDQGNLKIGMFSQKTN